MRRADRDGPSDLRRARSRWRARGACRRRWRSSWTATGSGWCWCRASRSCSGPHCRRRPSSGRRSRRRRSWRGSRPGSTRGCALYSLRPTQPMGGLWRSPTSSGPAVARCSTRTPPFLRERWTLPGSVRQDELDLLGTDMWWTRLRVFRRSTRRRSSAFPNESRRAQASDAGPGRDRLRARWTADEQRAEASVSPRDGRQLRASRTERVARRTPPRG